MNWFHAEKMSIKWPYTSVFSTCLCLSLHKIIFLWPYLQLMLLHATAQEGIRDGCQLLNAT